MFVSLPTGYGKSFCFVLLPQVFDMMRGVDKASIAIIISPLISLMQDQVMSVTRKLHQRSQGEIFYRVRYQLLFMSPESLFCNLDRRRMLSTDIYMTFIVDDVHCVTKW